MDDFSACIRDYSGSWIRKEAVMTGFVVESLVDTDLAPCSHV